jgi:hypothetical protein
MKRLVLLCAAIVLPAPAGAAPASQAVAESKLTHSSVSVVVDPQLNDGRLVIKIAAKNGTTAAIPFGPSSILITKPTGEAIAFNSLQQLVDDVRMAAGMAEAAPGQAPTPGAYAAAQTQVDNAGHPDVSGYTGGSGIATNEIVRRTNRALPKSKPSIDRATAEAQIAALKQAILQDSTIRPGQITVGQLVSEKLTFKKGEDRTLHLRVRIAGDEHSFTVAAPAG